MEKEFIFVEEWRDIPEWNYYQCSSLGRVRSLDKISQFGRYTGIKKGRVLKQKVNKYGYLCVALSDNGKRKDYTVHTLVYLTFIGPIPEGMQVNHIDENKNNNVVSNLNLLSPKANSNWGTRNNRISSKRSIPILQYSLDGKFIKEYYGSREAGRAINKNNSHIIQACKGKRKQAYGYIWKYKKEGV